MKKLLSVLLVFTFVKLYAQEENYTVIRESRVGCLPGGIEFQSQAQVDSFAINYPGCNTILGYVAIDGEDIINLNGLININRIEEELFLSMYDWNFTTSGLDSLHYTRGLYIYFNPSPNLEGLYNLDTINGNVRIYSSEIENLTGLENLKHIGGELMIAGAPELSSLDGLENLHSIGGDFDISNNDILSDISALSNLEAIGGYMWLYGNQNLTSLAALNNVDISTILGLSICSNESLSVCDEPFICQYLSNPTGPVTIYDNAPGCSNPSEIADSCGFTLSCLPFGQYYLTSQSAVDNFWQDYPACNILNGGLTIKGEGISNLSGMLGITGVNGGVNIFSTSLTDLSGFDSLIFITGGVQIGWWEGGSNPELINFNGLGNLESIEGEFLVMYNSSLENFHGLGSLHSVGDIIIKDNDILSSFDGLNALDTVYGSVKISGNPIVSVAAFENLRYIQNQLRIIENPLLTSLTGFNNATLNSLTIQSNPLLSECDIKSVCDLLAIPGGYTIIDNNASGCNSREEVEYECITGITEVIVENLLLYPNPANDFLMIKLAENLKSEALTIYNSSGQIVYNQSISTDEFWINISSLPCGLYMVDITGETVYWGKFVKIE